MFPPSQSPAGLQETDADGSSRPRRWCQEPAGRYRPIAAQDDGTLPPPLAPPQLCWPTGAGLFFFRGRQRHFVTVCNRRLMNWWGRSRELLEPNALHPRRTQWLCYFDESLWRIITCVNCSDAFIGDKTFPPLWLSYPKTEQKHFLNQGPGSSFLFELELCGREEKEPSGGAATGRTVSLKWRETTPSQSHQNTTTCWSAWSLATGTDSDVSGEPCRCICWYRVFDPSMWTLSSAEIPLRHHAEAASQCSIAPPVSLLLRTPGLPSASPAPVLFMDSDVAEGETEGATWRTYPNLSSASLLPEARTLSSSSCSSSSFLSISLSPLFPFCSHCPSPSWSLPQLLSEQVFKTPNVKNPPPSGCRQEKSLLTLNLVSYFYWLAPCFCVSHFHRSQSSPSVLIINPSIDSLFFFFCFQKFFKRYMFLKTGCFIVVGETGDFSVWSLLLQSPLSPHKWFSCF